MPIEEEVCQILHGMTLTQEEADTIARMAQIRVRKSKFEIGQKVRTIGPDTGGFNESREFVIDLISKDGTYTGRNAGWYQASSLELVEEPLAIGDEVEVIGPAGDEYITTPDDPKTFVITEIREPHDGFGRTYRTKNTGQPGYPASSLRKIPKPGTSWQITELQRLAEAEDKLASIEKQLAQFDREIGSLHNDISDCLIESGDVEARLGVRCMKIEKRLHDLEAWQKEQIEKEKAERRVKKAIVRGMLEQMAEPELKVGDYVEVMEESFSCTDLYIGKKLKVLKVDHYKARLEGGACGIWHSLYCLRKLPPEEIARRLNEGPA